MPKIRFYISITLSICLFISSLGFSQKQNYTTKELFFKRIKSMDDIEQFKCSLKITERGKKDPLSNLMRQDQHHTINKMGFDYFSAIVKYIAVKTGKRFDDRFKTEDGERYNTRPCYKVSIITKNYEYNTYTVGDNESITSIARKFFISEYKTLKVNPKLNDYFDILKKGRVLKVPNTYAKDVTLNIDRLYYLRIDIKVSDDKGLFEQYDYFYLQVS